MAYYLGIDVGTSATKALLITPRGHVKAVATAEHATSRPRDTWSEQNPRHWWSAVVKATGEAIASAAVLGHNYPGSDWYANSYELLTGRNLLPDDEDHDGFFSRVYRRVILGKWL